MTDTTQGLQNHLPSISVTPGSLAVTIVGALSLQFSGEGVALSASAQIRRRAGAMFQTQRIYDTGSPQWDATQEMEALRDDDILEFTVWMQPKFEQEKVYGRAYLEAKYIYPNGFSGSLELRHPNRSSIMAEEKGKTRTHILLRFH